jgi:predicted RNA methylase
MATDIQAVIAHLTGFYSFAGKEIISVGAGGGQLIEYGRGARRVLAVDCDPQALEALKKRLREAGLETVFEPRLADFLELEEKAEAVLFEFSLHEMPDPEKALRHARNLAADVVVIDHFPGSRWAYLVSEEAKVENSWEAVRRFPLRAEKKVETVQRFRDHDELYQKVKGQGETSIRRIEAFRSSRDFTVPMSYGLAWL